LQVRVQRRERERPGQPGSAAYFVDHQPEVEDFRAAVLAGLSASPKTVPPKFFYDEPGSNLFERICRTEEYYLTRTEIDLLRDKGPEIAELAGSQTVVVEYGCGSSRKIRALLDNLDAPAEYVAIDISRQHLGRVVADIAGDYAEIRVGGICADFTADLDLPREAGLNGIRKLGFFPGSTIGNMSPGEARKFLAGVRRQVAGDGALVIGVDLKKDERILNAAYNDADGVTAAFNLNILHRMNRELGSRIDVEKFEHLAFYNRSEGRIEMHLKSRAEQTVKIAGREFDFARDETIHTENSYKFHIEEFSELAGQAGFATEAAWTDPDDLFCILYLSAA
jgi:dimethylhistidine N-methyltransferase